MQRNFNKRIAVLLVVMIAVLFIPTTSYAANDVADTIKYTTDADEEVDFKKADFNEVCEDLTDEELDYVKFTLPSSSKGILYEDYDDDKAKVTKSDKYKYDGNPSISDVTFVPDDDYSGTVTISYTGWDEEDNEFTGSVKITVDDDDSDGKIKYSVDSDDTVTFKKSDFYNYCKSENKSTLDYLYFNQPSSSKGTLYYDYDDDKDKLDEDDEYYYGKSPSISDITFVPKSNYSGDCKISFTGYDIADDTIVGTVLISVGTEDLDEADDIAYTATAGSYFTFDDDDFNDVCEDLTDEELDYVKFTLPASSKGTLYYSYTSTGNYTSKISTSTKYYYDDSPYLRNVSFVPNDNSAGTVTIKYTGYDSDGNSFAGEINISVNAKTTSTNTASLYFSDVNGNYSWAVQYVDSLSSTGVLTGNANSNGTKSFNPSSKITRGDFMLLLYRALNLTSNSNTNGFSDVPSGSYYYQAITAAKALGIAQGVDNKFYPAATITREDAMVLALRAMSVSGTGYVAGDSSTLSSFYDKAVISDYAQDAIAALIKSGIITGDNNQIHPKDNITRAEAAAVIYRIKF